MKSILSLAATLSLVAIGGAAAAAPSKPHAYTGHELAPKAKVTIAQARVIALTRAAFL